jgi:hypothetical protein
MDAFHILWTKPKSKRNLPFDMNKAEILTMLVSALMWKKHNGKIKLFTDNHGLKFINNNGLADTWDEIDSVVLETNNYPIDAIVFWAAGKLIALEASQCPCVMLDTDLIVMHSISNQLNNSVITALHPEPLNPDVYLNPTHLKRPKEYGFPHYYDWNTLPSNTAFLYIKDNKLKDFYIEESKRFMFNNFEKPKENVSQMVFAEQRILSICAKYMDYPVEYILQEPFSQDNKAIIHLWGYKSTLRSNKYRHNVFIRKLIDRFEQELEDFNQFNIVIEKYEASIN